MIFLDLGFARYPLLLSLSLSWKEKWWEGGESGRKGKVLVWVTLLQIRRVLFEAFILARCFRWKIDTHHSYETLTVPIIRLFRPLQLSNETEVIEASNIDLRHDWMRNRSLICIGRVARQMRWAITLASTGSRRTLHQYAVIHACLDKSYSCCSILLCASQRGMACVFPALTSAQMGQSWALTLLPPFIVCRCASHTK